MVNHLAMLEALPSLPIVPRSFARQHLRWTRPVSSEPCFRWQSTQDRVYSTGLGYGFATPHCKTGAVAADSICVLRLKEPINWGSVDGEQVRMVVLLALRNSGSANNHMQVFSSLARKLMNEEFRQHLLDLEDANGIIAYLAEQLGVH